MQFAKSLVTLVILLATLGGCASQSAVEQAETQNTASEKDPLESVNRVMWDINWNVLDKYFLRPLTVGYVTVMPQFARTGLLNAADNLQEPANFMNNVLQGKVDDGMDSLARFMLNTSVGVFGTIDVASKLGIEVKQEEFGETLGVWGVDTGPYMMLPALGPNDPRSFTGDIVDGTVYPMAIIEGNFAVARYVVSLLETRAALMEQEAQLAQSLDDYAFVRDAYFARLEFLVTDGANLDDDNIEETLDDFAEFESMFDDFEDGSEEQEEDKQKPQ